MPPSSARGSTPARRQRPSVPVPPSTSQLRSPTWTRNPAGPRSRSGTVVPDPRTTNLNPRSASRRVLELVELEPHPVERLVAERDRELLDHRLERAGAREVPGEEPHRVGAVLERV